jgi:hypothetical protein
VLENACRYGRSVVNVTIARRNAEIVYLIADDGPGSPSTSGSTSSSQEDGAERGAGTEAAPASASHWRAA